MPPLLRPAVLLAALALAAGVAAAPVAPLPAVLQHKADPWVQERVAAGGEEEFLVLLAAPRADLAPALRAPTKADRGRYVVGQLRAAAERAQAPLAAWLTARGVPHRAFWIVNMVLVKGDAALAAEIAGRADVARLAANPRVRLALPPGAGAAPTPAAPFAPLAPGARTAIEWGVARIRAPELWALGHDGQGVVVAGADTGYDWTHPALKGKYRGWDGSVANHDYAWHDAIHAGGGLCGADAPAPCDDYTPSHGTHTMGTMVGDDGAGNQVGVAPGARWIGCRNMDQGVGTPATYTECFQWFLAPTTIAGTAPEPALAPHVINNSWGCPPSEGCTDPTVLQGVIDAVRAAGIVVVASAGNSGPSCATVADPPAIYAHALSIGATDASDVAAAFSSRGPVAIDGSNRLKPDLSAPGVNVRSSLRGGGYGVLSGTSMASPHAAGAVALLLSAYPALKGQPDVLRRMLTTTAVPRTSAQSCGGIDGAAVPNHTYGWGRLDALAAYAGGVPAYPALVAAALRRQHGAAGSFDLPLSLSPGDPTTEPRDGPDATLVLTFDRVITGASVTVAAGTAAAAAPALSGHDVLVDLSGVADLQYVTVAATDVVSADSLAAGAASVRVGFLAGDVGGNRIVTLSDLLRVNAALAQDVGAANFRYDVNRSGTLSLPDVLRVNARLAQSLPAP